MLRHSLPAAGAMPLPTPLRLCQCRCRPPLRGHAARATAPARSLHHATTSVHRSVTLRTHPGHTAALLRSLHHTSASSLHRTLQPSRLFSSTSTSTAPAVASTNSPAADAADPRVEASQHQKQLGRSVYRSLYNVCHKLDHKVHSSLYESIFVALTIDLLKIEVPVKETLSSGTYKASSKSKDAASTDANDLFCDVSTPIQQQLPLTLQALRKIGHERQNGTLKTLNWRHILRSAFTSQQEQRQPARVWQQNLQESLRVLRHFGKFGAQYQILNRSKYALNRWKMINTTALQNEHQVQQLKNATSIERAKALMRGISLKSTTADKATAEPAAESENANSQHPSASQQQQRKISIPYHIEDGGIIIASTYSSNANSADIEAYIRREINAIAEQVKQKIVERQSELAAVVGRTGGSELHGWEKLEVIHRVMFADLKFSSAPTATADTMDRDLLNRVLATHNGSPVSIGVIYMAVARQLGLKVDGIEQLRFMCKYTTNVDVEELRQQQRAGVIGEIGELLLKFVDTAKDSSDSNTKPTSKLATQYYDIVFAPDAAGEAVVYPHSEHPSFVVDLTQKSHLPTSGSNGVTFKSELSKLEQRALGKRGSKPSSSSSSSSSSSDSKDDSSQPQLLPIKNFTEMLRSMTSPTAQTPISSNNHRSADASDSRWMKDLQKFVNISDDFIERVSNGRKAAKQDQEAEAVAEGEPPAEVQVTHAFRAFSDSLLVTARYVEMSTEEWGKLSSTKQQNAHRSVQKSWSIIADALQEDGHDAEYVERMRSSLTQLFTTLLDMRVIHPVKPNNKAAASSNGSTAYVDLFAPYRQFIGEGFKKFHSALQYHFGNRSSLLTLDDDAEADDSSDSTTAGSKLLPQDQPFFTGLRPATARQIWLRQLRNIATNALSNVHYLLWRFAVQQYQLIDSQTKHQMERAQLAVEANLRRKLFQAAKRDSEGDSSRRGGGGSDLPGGGSGPSPGVTVVVLNYGNGRDGEDSNDKDDDD